MHLQPQKENRWVSKREYFINITVTLVLVLFTFALLFVPRITLNAPLKEIVNINSSYADKGITISNVFGSKRIVKPLDKINTNKNISINEPIGFDKEGNEISILDVIKAPRPDFIEEINLKDNVKLLNSYLKVLTKREREIIVKRYGLEGNDLWTQKQIADKLNISRSYVSRIEKRALTKILREFIKNNKYNDVDFS